MAIDTIMLSFCEDAESHGDHAQHAPPLLLAAVGDAPRGAIASKRQTAVQPAPAAEEEP